MLRSMMTGSLPELANLQASDRVLAIHKEYIEAGATDYQN